MVKKDQMVKISNFFREETMKVIIFASLIILGIQSTVQGKELVFEEIKLEKN